ncbi:MAG: flippase-like domain-containing protein [Acidobacteria bacterium]|nr:flippase-like domain-containing protein [Acidobacteriota bacterium]
MNRSRRWILVGLGLLALAGLLAYSIRTDPQWQAFEPSTFLDSLVSVDKVWMGWALLSIYATYLVRALRWKVLMARQKPHARLWNLFSATVIGFAAIGIFGRAGEMVRPYLVARKEGLPVSSQVGVWVLERAFDMMTVLVTVAFALAHFDAAALRSSPTLTRILHLSGNLVASSMLVIVLLMVGLRNFAEPFSAWLIERLRFLSPRRLRSVERHLQSFVEGSRAVRSLSTVAACTLYSMAEWALVAFCYNAVFNSFSGGLRLGVSEILIFMGSVMAGSMVQIPGVGGGIQVASLLVLTEVFAIRPEVAASISLLIWIFTFLAVVPPAVLLAFYEGLSWGKLRRLESEN